MILKEFIQKETTSTNSASLAQQVSLITFLPISQTFGQKQEKKKKKQWSNQNISKQIDNFERLISNMRHFIDKQRQKSGQNVKNNQIIESPPRKETKYNQIVQLKDQLVKMKQFLSNQLPQVQKLVPTRNYLKESICSKASQTLSNYNMIQISSINRKLLFQNQRLTAQLSREKSLKKQLTRSLKKQQKMLNNLYDSHTNLQKRHQSKQSLSLAQRQKFKQKQKVYKTQSKKYLSIKIRKPQDQIRRSVDNKINKFCKIGKDISQKFDTKTSILGALQTNKKNRLRQTAPCFSSSQEQLIANLNQIGKLQKRMQQLKLQCQKTVNWGKKLQYRSQIDIIANKLIHLKESFGKSN